MKSADDLQMKSADEQNRPRRAGCEIDDGRRVQGRPEAGRARSP